MAYYPYPQFQNFYPQQILPQQSYITTPQPQQSSNTINWVQGEVGAKAFPVQAGNSVLLMDSDGQYFYIKSADASGMPSLRRYTYHEVVEDVPKIEQSHEAPQTVSREEVQTMQREIDRLKEELETMRMKQPQLPVPVGGNNNVQ